jgi:hypothetical protein
LYCVQSCASEISLPGVMAQLMMSRRMRSYARSVSSGVMTPMVKF